MKKIVTIMLVILLLSIYSSFVFAASTPISLTGDSTAKPNETKTLTMQISSEKLIGVVSGIVCYFLKIDDSMLNSILLGIMSTMSAGGIADLIKIPKTDDDTLSEG